MAHEFLNRYLNDHLAGAQAAMEMLALLRRLDDSSVWKQLEHDIAEDRRELEDLIKATGAAPSMIRRGAAWTAEKLAELKVYADDPAGGEFRRLELIELLAMGIDGKRALWRALQKASAHQPAVGALDYSRLIARAEEQRRVVEEERLGAAEAALSAA